MLLLLRVAEQEVLEQERVFPSLLALLIRLRLEQAALAAPVVEVVRHIKGQPAAIPFLAPLLLLEAAVVVETAQLRLD